LKNKEGKLPGSGEVAGIHVAGPQNLLIQAQAHLANLVYTYNLQYLVIGICMPDFGRFCCLLIVTVMGNQIPDSSRVPRRWIGFESV
jgi:hypothetical protein